MAPDVLPQCLGLTVPRLRTRRLADNPCCSFPASFALLQHFALHLQLAPEVALGDSPPPVTSWQDSCSWDWGSGLGGLVWLLVCAQSPVG